MRYKILNIVRSQLEKIIEQGLEVSCCQRASLGVDLVPCNYRVDRDGRVLLIGKSYSSHGVLRVHGQRPLVIGLCPKRYWGIMTEKSIELCVIGISY